MEYVGYIYKIINNINDKVYIGQTTRNIGTRWKEHQNDSKYHDTKFYRAIKKHDKNNFMVNKIEKLTASSQCELDNILDERECYWIKYFDSFKNGYNSNEGGGYKSHLIGINGKRVCQYDANGILVNIFNTAREAEKHTNIAFGQISACCTKNIKTTNGFIFRFEAEPLTKADILFIKRRKNTDVKSVNQYSLEGKYVASYSSSAEAERETGMTAASISKCCRREGLSAGEFIWRFSDEGVTAEDIMRIKFKQTNKSKKVSQYSSENILLNTYSSIAEAKKLTGILHISLVCNGIRPMAGGYIWKFAEY